MIAVGVAKPRAQGQAMTNTATACMIAVSKIPLMAQVATKVTKAIARTIGTKIPEILSANF